MVSACIAGVDRAGVYGWVFDWGDEMKKPQCTTTAEAYEREVQANAVTKLATEWLPHMKRRDWTSSINQTLHNLAVDDCIKHSLAYATELRAAHKGKE